MSCLRMPRIRLFGKRGGVDGGGGGGGGGGSSRSALWLAVLANETERAKQLLAETPGLDLNEPFDPSVKDEFSKRCRAKTLLNVAVRRANVELLKALVEHEANVREDVDALHWAVMKDSLSMVRVLMQHGADPDTTVQYTEDIDSDDRDERLNALHIALRFGSDVMVLFLVRGGASVRRKTGTGRSPLHLAVAYSKSAAVIEELLERGADPSEKDYSEQSPLQMSFLEANVHLLLEYGADLADLDRCSGSLPPNARLAAVKHLAMLDAADAGGEPTLDRIPLGSRTLYHQCISEIERMKQKRINDSVTFYSLLSGSQASVVDVLRQNEHFFLLLRSARYGKLFPLYKTLFDIKLNRAERRKVRLVRLEAGLSRLMPCRLPDNVIRVILRYLSKTDVANLNFE